MAREKKTEKGIKERKPNYAEYTASLDEIQAFINDRMLLRHNVVTGRTEYRLLSSYEHDATEWQPISDRQVTSIWRQMSQQLKKKVNIKYIYDLLCSDFVPDYHPFKFYLEHLPKWDGQDYILGMSVSVTVKGDSEMREQALFAQYLKKWLVGMVAGWIDDDVVNNVILVLLGEQGSYKTTWFNYLLPPELKQYFYTKTNANRMGRDDLLTLAKYGLVCCEELDTMRPSELNQLKAAVTMPSIDEREAYAHFHEHRQHIASFCGTGNNPQFLSDPTGNRRWLPFEIESILSPRDHPFNYEGIYSQAYALYQQGFQFWFSQQEIQQLSAHNKQFEAPKLEQELVHLYFRKPVGVEGGIFMSVARAMQIVSANLSQKLSPEHLGRAFNELGFKRVKYSGQRGYIVMIRTADEIQRIQRLMVDEGEVDSGQ
nr:VapE domain-containing protein [uncultured Prevotella sp.]